MKNMQNPTPDDILAVIDSVGRLQAENSLNWTPQPFKAMLAPATRCALLLSLGFILFWLLISSCASQSEARLIV